MIPTRPEKQAVGFVRGLIADAPYAILDYPMIIP